MLRSLVGSEMCIRDSVEAGHRGVLEYRLGQALRTLAGDVVHADAVWTPAEANSMTSLLAGVQWAPDVIGR